MSRRFLIFAAMVTLALAAGIVYELARPVPLHGSVISPPKPMAAFTLDSVDGPVNTGEFAGRFVLLYFGYTACPDLCPTTLAALREVVARAGAGVEDVQVIFVSVDPARDTPERLDMYVKHLDPDFLGVTGTREQIDQVTQAYGIYYQLGTPDPATGFYTVDHSSSVLILNPGGDLVMTWPYGTDIDYMASDLRQLLQEHARSGR